MRIVSWNINSVRLRAPLVEKLAAQISPDVICLQETKANQEDVDVSAIEKMGYQTFWYSDQKKGYSGVAIFTKIKPDQVLYGNGIDQSDAEGRIIRADFGDITLINAYFPSGTSGEERQTYKYQWLDEFFTYVQELRKKRKKLIVTGDYNIAHTEIDIHDPKGNKKSSGFLPEERAWMDQFLANKWVDTFRHLHPEATGAYSWWSQRFPSVRLQNKGWRIDYISITDTLAPQLKAAAIYPDVKHSDHCPIYAEII